MAHLLIVDDEPAICWGIAKLAERMGHQVSVAATAEEGLDSARRQRPDAAFLDVRLPGMDGLAAMQELRKIDSSIPVVVMTAFGDLQTAVSALEGGASEYLVKPFDLATAQRAVDRILTLTQPSNKTEDSSSTAGVADIIGSTPAMREVFKQIALVAPSLTCVHIYGESGTGKELVARAVHRYSQRRQQPFVAVNLASLNPDVVESELFGHVRGAFTGAEQTRTGLLEQASGGTIFLDEIAETPLSLQVKLLRVLETGEVLPVGASEPVKVDLRIISATHRSLVKLVQTGAFRHDLFYRLAVFEIDLPPLRERVDDIPYLAEYFLATLSVKNGLPRARLSPQIVEELQRRPWYGNVRELCNALEHALIVSRGGAIDPSALPPPNLPLLDDAPGASNMRHPLLPAITHWSEDRLAAAEEQGDLLAELAAEVEPPLIQAALEACHGQVATAARRLGLHRVTLARKIAQYGLGRDEKPEQAQ